MILAPRHETRQGYAGPCPKRQKQIVITMWTWNLGMVMHSKCGNRMAINFRLTRGIQQDLISVKQSKRNPNNNKTVNLGNLVKYLSPKHNAEEANIRFMVLGFLVTFCFSFSFLPWHSSLLPTVRPKRLCFVEFAWFWGWTLGLVWTE